MFWIACQDRLGYYAAAAAAATVDIAEQRFFFFLIQKPPARTENICTNILKTHSHTIPTINPRRVDAYPALRMSGLHSGQVGSSSQSHTERRPSTLTSTVKVTSEPAVCVFGTVGGSWRPHYYHPPLVELVLNASHGVATKAIRQHMSQAEMKSLAPKMHNHNAKRLHQKNQ